MPETFNTTINPKRPNKQYVQFDQPKMIGYFSVDASRNFVPDASQLRYLKMPCTRNLRLDLNDGIKDFCLKPDSVKQEKMDFLLHFIANNIQKLKAENGYHACKKLLKSDIICSRGRLVQIMCPKYNSDKWSLILSKYKGNIYICQPDGDNFFTKRTAYGFKFEQFMLSENPIDDPITDVPVIEAEEFYSVFESKIGRGIGDFSLLYNAEMDGVDSDVEVNLSEANFNRLKFVELKTCLGLDKNNYCRWWAHSFLARVSNIIVGHRTQDGIVTKLDNIDIDKLRNEPQVNLSLSKSTDLLKEFLNSVKMDCRNLDCPDTVYKYDYDPKDCNTITCTIFRGKNEYSFLPDWYVNAIDKHIG